MECEICGKETSELKRVELEGTTLIVCPECASYGKEIEEEEDMPVRVKTASRKARPIGLPRYEEDNLDLGLEIVPDYGRRIKQARERRGLMVKELAMKIFEKESLVHRIENQSILPSDDMVEKLEKTLGIMLRKKAEKQGSQLD